MVGLGGGELGGDECWEGREGSVEGLLGMCLEREGKEMYENEIGIVYVHDRMVMVKMKRDVVMVVTKTFG